MTEEIAHPLVPHGAVPKVVPQHLQGEVWDFRNEPDGKISFQHPKASIGLSPDDSRVYMTPDEYKLSFDPAYRMTHLEEAANNGYAPLQRIPKTSARQWSDSIASGIGKALDWGSSAQGKAVGTAGLLSALAGGWLSVGTQQAGGRESDQARAPGCAACRRRGRCRYRVGAEQAQPPRGVAFKAGIDGLDASRHSAAEQRSVDQLWAARADPARPRKRQIF